VQKKVSSKFKKPRKNKFSYEKKEDKIYLEGVVIESLPGTRFNVQVNRPNLEPLVVLCNTRTFFKVTKIKILKGDKVEIEIDPNQDLTKGTIVERH